MSWTLIAGFLFLAIVLKLVTQNRKKTTKSENYPYQKLQALFTPAERSYFGVLKQAVGNDVEIFGKVRVADVISPIKGMPRGAWQKAFNKVSGKHFDFLLCDKADLSVICAIELDDKSHRAANRKKRDEFLKGACTSAGIPLVQVPAKSGYVIADVQALLAQYLPEVEPIATTTLEVVEPILQVPVQSEVREEERVCPKCSSPMIIRKAKKGKHAGENFWACRAYPKCRYIETMHDEKTVEKMEK